MERAGQVVWKQETKATNGLCIRMATTLEFTEDGRGTKDHHIKRLVGTRWDNQLLGGDHSFFYHAWSTLFILSLLPPFSGLFPWFKGKIYHFLLKLGYGDNVRQLPSMP